MLLPLDPRTALADPSPLANGRDADRCAAVTALPVTPDDLCGWLAMAMPGSATVYHRGHLGRDRCRSTTRLSERDRQGLIALARQALLAAEAGRVHLLQRRHGDGDYSYIAVKARTLRRASGATPEHPIQDEEHQRSGLPDLSMTGAALPSSRSRQCQSAREGA
jgi:hypothetical protein